MAGNELSGSPFPSAVDNAASKEYMDRVGVHARAFVKDNGNFATHTPLNNLPERLIRT